MMARLETPVLEETGVDPSPSQYSPESLIFGYAGEV
jgi:hypothetical protein